MVRILPFFAAALAACTSSPQDTAMPSKNPDQATPALGSSGAGSDGQASGAPNPVPATEKLLPAVPADSPAEAQGRRTLSTAFVRVGPDGHLTVELRNGHVLVLRNVVMRRRDYCGEQVLGGPAGRQYCGGYAEVAAARPGGAPSPEAPDLAARGPAKGN